VPPDARRTVVGSAMILVTPYDSTVCPEARF
jgi:hypothetical protein